MRIGQIDVCVGHCQIKGKVLQGRSGKCEVRRGMRVGGGERKEGGEGKLEKHGKIPYGDGHFII